MAASRGLTRSRGGRLSKRRGPPPTPKPPDAERAVATPAPASISTTTRASSPRSRRSRGPPSGPRCSRRSAASPASSRRPTATGPDPRGERRRRRHQAQARRAARPLRHGRHRLRRDGRERPDRAGRRAARLPRLPRDGRARHARSPREALRGVAEGCRRAGCALLGGETATMPGIYAKGDLELVGFGVGVVERERVIDGSSIGDGDVLIGIASNGVHSNGFSLVRAILEQGVRAGRFDLRDAPPELNTLARQRAARADPHLRAPGAEPDARLHAQRPRPRHRRRLRRQRAARAAPRRARPHRPRRLAAPADLRLPAAPRRDRRDRDAARLQLRHRHDPGGAARADAQDVRERLHGMGERAYEIGVVERKPARGRRADPLRGARRAGAG